VNKPSSTLTQFLLLIVECLPRSTPIKIHLLPQVRVKDNLDIEKRKRDQKTEDLLPSPQRRSRHLYNTLPHHHTPLRPAEHRRRTRSPSAIVVVSQVVHLRRRSLPLTVGGQSRWTRPGWVLRVWRWSCPQVSRRLVHA